MQKKVKYKQLSLLKLNIKVSLTCTCFKYYRKWFHKKINEKECSWNYHAQAQTSNFERNLLKVLFKSFISEWFLSVTINNDPILHFFHREYECSTCSKKWIKMITLLLIKRENNFNAINGRL